MIYFQNLKVNYCISYEIKYVFLKLDSEVFFSSYELRHHLYAASPHSILAGIG